MSFHRTTPIVLAIAALSATLALGADAKPPVKQARVIVAFKPGAAAAARAAVKQHGGRVEVDLGEVNAMAVSMPAAAVAGLQRNPHVEYVEEDAVRHTMIAPTSPSAPPYLPGQREPYGIRMVQADRLPDTFAADRTVCIVDSGYDTSHEDLAANFATGRNLTRSAAKNFY